LLYAFSGYILVAFEFFHDNLPLMLPILTVALSVMLRPDLLTKIDGWLNLSNYFARGLVSFAIWAFVAGQGVKQYIHINPVKVLNKEHCLPLICGAFVWAGFCSVIAALAAIGGEEAHRKWRLAQAFLFAISLAALFMPFYLFESKITVEHRLGVSFDERPFTVAIPFRDAALNQHLGRTSTPINQCVVYRSVTAKTASDARELALRTFRASNEFLQFGKDRRPGNTPPLSVEINENLVVAAPDPSSF
jgi:hypothetical protein